MDHAHARRQQEQLIASALHRARQTRLFRLQHGVRHQVAAAVKQLCGACATVVVADRHTFEAAGRDVWDGLSRGGQACLDPYIFPQSELHAEYQHVEQLRDYLAGVGEAIPIAVGAGTINDLTKLAAHQLGRPYLVVATAASMDGYAAYGASIQKDGFKKTRACAAPVGILADLEVLEAAPQRLNASGYADLLAKVVAGADWVLADAAGLDQIDQTAWDMVQRYLRGWVQDPAGVRAGRSAALQHLMLGLIMSGLAMQWAETSRPASGAEHQFSHLWDMLYPGSGSPQRSHGFQVGLGTLASAALYQSLLDRGQGGLDAQAAASRWPSLEFWQEEIDARLQDPRVVAAAWQETREKYVSPEQLCQQLERFQGQWQPLCERLRRQLLSFEQLRQMLSAAGCPATPAELGVSPSQLRDSYWGAYFIRSRFTVLDLAVRAGWLEACLHDIFGADGPWRL